MNWLIDTNCPLIFAGATSAMYNGDKSDAIPTPNPPMRRYAKNISRLLASPDPIAEMAKSNDETMSRGFRPYLPLNLPANPAPIIQPI